MSRWTSNNIKARAGRTSIHKPGKMNKLEAEYAHCLDMLKSSGEIADYSFEAVKLRLADRTFYTPDFMVLMPDGVIEFHETKGFWQDDARVKIKVAAEMHPYKFVAITKVKGSWKREEF